MVNEFEQDLRDPVPFVTVRSLLLITPLAAISVGGFFATRNGALVWCTAGSSVILMGVAVLISLTAAYSRQIRRPKFFCVTFASTVFIISISSASFIHQSEIEFRLLGDLGSNGP